MSEAFFTLHRDLPREGPGVPADVVWTAELAGIATRARIADVACGPGGDIRALLSVAPDGHITALDKTAHFVAEVRAVHGPDPRVTVLQADMAVIHNRFDMIWCAGAVYFLGVTQALTAWRKALTPGGVVAFSEPCWFTPDAPERAKALFADYPQMTDAAGICDLVAAADYDVLGTRALPTAAWEAYYRPLEARIAALRPGADATLNAVLDETEEEIATWRAHHGAFGYLLVVARPK